MVFFDSLSGRQPAQSLLRSEVPGYVSLPTPPFASQLNRRVAGKAANSSGSPGRDAAQKGCEASKTT